MFPFDDAIMLTDATIGSFSVFGDSSDESYIRFTEMLYIIPSGHHSNNDDKEYKIKFFQWQRNKISSECFLPVALYSVLNTMR